MIAVVLTCIKLTAAFLSDATSVFSEAIHALLDCVSALIAFLTLRHAAKPADAEHPFGHEKIETLASLSESLLLVGAASFIVYESIHDFAHPRTLQNLPLTCFFLVLSGAISWRASSMQQKVADSTGSNAIAVNALHFFSDALASGALFLGMTAIALTHISWIDPLLALCVACYILAGAYSHIKEAIYDLGDWGLPAQELAQIQSLLHTHKAIGIRDLRTRRSGRMRHIDFRLIVCGSMTVQESHDVCDELEKRIQSQTPNSSVTIHVEPCETYAACMITTNR